VLLLLLPSSSSSSYRRVTPACTVIAYRSLLYYDHHIHLYIMRTKNGVLTTRRRRLRDRWRMICRSSSIAARVNPLSFLSAVSGLNILFYDRPRQRFSLIGFWRGPSMVFWKSLAGRLLFLFFRHTYFNFYNMFAIISITTDVRRDI